MHFDLSTFDIYGTIAAGAQIHLLTPEISLLPHKLADFIREHELTQWFSVPWVLHQLAQFDVIRYHDFPAMTRLLWCGEKLPTPALMHWMRRLPHVTFDNLYGPTEATIASSYYRVPRCPEDPAAEIPIGSPCRGELLLVLDGHLRPVKPGEIGDLYIGGVGLSPGYWKNPEKSQEVFRRNPYSSNPSDRIYKTGDLARIGPDSMIYLVGRSDSQIKSRGYRIELGEIEAAIHATGGVRDAAVVALDSTDPDKKVICCAYVPDPGADLSLLALRSRLTETLPRYMLPQRWMALMDLPRNNNGKTDRPLLRQYFERQADADRHEDVDRPARKAPGNFPDVAVNVLPVNILRSEQGLGVNQENRMRSDEVPLTEQISALIGEKLLTEVSLARSGSARFRRARFSHLGSTADGSRIALRGRHSTRRIGIDDFRTLASIARLVERRIATLPGRAGLGNKNTLQSGTAGQTSRSAPPFSAPGIGGGERQS